MIARFLDAIDAAVEAGDLARAAQVVDVLSGLALKPTSADAVMGMPLLRFGRSAGAAQGRAAIEVFERLWPRSNLAAELKLNLELRERRLAMRFRVAQLDDADQLATLYRELQGDRVVEAHEAAVRWHEVAPSRTSLAARVAITRRAPDLDVPARRRAISAAIDGDRDHVNDAVLATVAGFCLDIGNVPLAQATCEVLLTTRGGSRLAESVLGRIAVDRKNAGGDKGERDREREAVDLEDRRERAAEQFQDGADGTARRSLAIDRVLERFRAG